MLVSRPKTSLLFSLLLLTLFSIPITARADDDEPDEYDVKARVARISLMAGEVSLKRNGNKDWEPARLNYPLVEGDTVATDKDSRLEIQVDGRNFVRLAANSILRLVTLRDEGIALSVVEGTAVVRLAKFDRTREYFEIDAPRTTLAAEKPGLYRIDVPREGRVRLTVREGGSARIYSDTSGFALRDGRSAELIIAGENTGDWELLVAAPRDAIDDWVNEREQYLAKRLRYDVQYFDEHVWGAEDLDAYGDWSYTNDFGWIWRPRATFIAGYSNWAPYRYGHWTWCPPYGWTWVGYEPWGWAPYHYGRWVYHNNYWAWCPRSRFYRNRSWWRPALVAFVSFDFSFGNNICWYPLSYYQRDPHSRRYRHDDRRGPGYGGGGGGRDNRHQYDKVWRGVTRVPRRDFGNADRRGQPVDETTARRVIDTDPQRGDLPRGGVARNAPGDRDDVADRAARRTPIIQDPDRSTGAAERTPGISLDEDLRRQRVFRGRDPRPTEPTETNVSPGTVTPPSGAVARPELPPAPRPNRGEPRQDPPRQEPPRQDPPGASDQPRSADPPGRIVRPTMPEGIEKRGRGRQGIETTPPATPPSTSEPPRSEQPAPRSEPPRNEQPAPRSEPRTEQPAPRPEPRTERPAPRYEPRNESPRSEPPRSEPPRSESRPAPPSEPSRSESPRSESPRSESPRSESPRSEPPRSEPPRSESPRTESPRSAPDRPRPDRPDNQIR